MTPSVPCCTCTYIYIKSKLGIGESMIGMHAYFSAMPLQVRSRLSGANVGNVGEGSDGEVAGGGRGLHSRNTYRIVSCFRQEVELLF